MVEDEEILNLIKDPKTTNAGYRNLMQKYQQKLYWTIRRIVLTHEHADDVLQEVMIKVYRNISKFNGDAKLYTWLYRIATNEALSFLKKEKRHKSITIDSEGQENIINQLKADPHWNGNEIQAAFYQAIEKLPDKQKLVFQLRYFEELSYKEISEKLGTSVGSLKASLHHAVKKIKEELKLIDHYG